MTEYDVVGVGAALVDVLVHADDDFLHRYGIEKDAMNLVDSERSAVLYAAVGPGTEVSGGSMANSIAGLASAGRSVSFIGRVHDDQLGRVFRHDIEAAGVRYLTPPATEGSPTGNCLVIVTPDSARSMVPSLGASIELRPEDIDAEAVSNSSVVFLEGYLLDYPLGEQIIERAVTLAKAAGGRVAFTLSDSRLVERHHDRMSKLVTGEVDILFANDKELVALSRTDWDEAVERASDLASIVAITCSEKGSVVFADGTRYDIPAEPTKVVDTTGAGDLYAAGFLAALTAGKTTPETWGRWGSIAAAEVIGHLGARPQIDLKRLLN